MIAVVKEGYKERISGSFEQYKNVFSAPTMSKLDMEMIDWIRGKNGIHRGSGPLLCRMFGGYKEISNWKITIARTKNREVV